jgi:hypothetical protein
MGHVSLRRDDRGFVRIVGDGTPAAEMALDKTVADTRLPTLPPQAPPSAAEFEPHTEPDPIAPRPEATQMLDARRIAERMRRQATFLDAAIRVRRASASQALDFIETLTHGLFALGTAIAVAGGCVRAVNLLRGGAAVIAGAVTCALAGHLGEALHRRDIRRLEQQRQGVKQSADGWERVGRAMGAEVTRVIGKASRAAGE